MHSSWLLAPLCRLFGTVGAFVALATGCLTCVSVVMRALWSTPIPGDVEMTQMGIAFAISMCLPYCQLQKANIIVDFFTQSTSKGTRSFLDAIGSLMLCASAPAAYTVVNGQVVVSEGQLTRVELGRVIERHNQFAVQLAAGH